MNRMHLLESPDTPNGCAKIYKALNDEPQKRTSGEMSRKI